MHKILVLYPEPADRAAFEDYYVNMHLPLAAKLPGVNVPNFATGGAAVVNYPLETLFG